MSTKLNCDIVRDLLPSYVDKLTSETTNEAVNEHLKECTECTEVLQRMKEPEKTGSEPKTEVNYLKKIRRRSLQKGFIVCAVIVILVLAAAAFRILYIGEKAYTEDFYSDLSVTDNTVKISGDFGISGSGAARIAFSEKNGVVDITIYYAPKCFINSMTFDREYTAKNDIKKVRVNGLTRWENGVLIGETAAELYSLKNPYVGDMVANAKIAGALGVANHFGGYSNELHTAAEPYGWTLILDDAFSSYNEEEVQKIMMRDSCVLIALIDNLNYVTWEYTVEGEHKEYTITAEHASNFAGRDIKSFSSSATEVQNLLDKLNMNKYGKEITLLTEEAFFMNIENNTDINIKDIAIDYYLDGKSLATQAAQNANGWEVAKGSSLEFRFTSADFPFKTQGYKLQQFSFDLRVTDTDGKEYTVCEGKKFPVQYGHGYRFSLTGNNESGFALTER